MRHRNGGGLVGAIQGPVLHFRAGLPGFRCRDGVPVPLGAVSETTTALRGSGGGTLYCHPGRRIGVHLAHGDAGMGVANKGKMLKADRNPLSAFSLCARSIR